MKVNFFVIAPPRLLEGMPTSFVSAFRIEPGGEAVLSELSARFPNITIVDVAAALRQAQDVVDQLVSAVQLIFLFALGAGLLVLYSALVKSVLKPLRGNIDPRRQKPRRASTAPQ